MPLFDSEGVLKMGKQKLMFYEKRIGDGNNVLRLEDFKATNGPDLFVYLSTDKNATEFVNLGKLKASNGNQNYELYFNLRKKLKQKIGSKKKTSNDFLHFDFLISTFKFLRGLKTQNNQRFSTQWFDFLISTFKFLREIVLSSTYGTNLPLGSGGHGSRSAALQKPYVKILKLF